MAHNLSAPVPDAPLLPEGPIQTSEHVSCCVVGAGPAGAVLALLLARQGIPVTLLEAHPDFERTFRGDLIHPAVLEVLDEVGLAEKLLKLPHTRIRRINLHSPRGSLLAVDLGRIQGRFPYAVVLPQARFLRFVTDAAQQFPSFKLVLAANVQRLVEQRGVVCGVRYRARDNAWHEVLAPLTVATDGRNSRLRRLAGLKPVRTAPPIDVLWFRLPRQSSTPDEEINGYLAPGRFVVVLNYGEQWQVGYVFPKGSYQDLRAAGLARLRRSIAEAVLPLERSVEALRSWDQVALLSVNATRLPCWSRPGLLCIGDSAHAMSPVGGVGMQYAIQDAVVAANQLAGPLHRRTVSRSDLLAVQRQREWPTRIIQWLQAIDQRQVIQRALLAREAFHLPLWFRLLARTPFLRGLPARLFAFGVTRVHVAGSSTER
jgi:2-polyprenyl-6-methoxyphenol hydroxylase-like FAD-dependent oxidoreductase